MTTKYQLMEWKKITNLGFAENICKLLSSFFSTTTINMEITIFIFFNPFSYLSKSLSILPFVIEEESTRLGAGSWTQSKGAAFH